MKRFFAFLAAAGLLLSIVVHFSTFLGFDPISRFPLVWLLHIGIFVVFIPAIIAANKAPATKTTSSASLFPNAPRWLIVAVGVFFAYALINFVILMYLMRDGSPTRRDNGSFAITDHGRFVRKISEQEFHRYQAYEVRGFSGHWMAFYCISMATLVSAARGEAKQEKEGG